MTDALLLSLPDLTDLNARFGANIQRTMRLLSTSTPQCRHRVRILLYGQSGMRMPYAWRLGDQIKARFPHADLDLRNRAIGGYSTDMLWRPAEHDVYPFYPDLIVLQVNGSHIRYEEILASIRRRTTSEVLLVSDPPRWIDPGDGQGHPAERASERWGNTLGLTHLPHFAQKYRLELADIRTLWTAYLRQHNLKASDLFPPGEHDYSEHGQQLMQALVNRYLRYAPELVDPSAAMDNCVRTHTLGKDIAFKDGCLSVPFTGNRIELIAAHSPSAKPCRLEVRVDGRRPSEFPELYAITRPNDVPGKDWPWAVGSCCRVAAQAPLIAEDWTLTFTEMADDASSFAFEVRGSVTGPDGRGTSAQRFLSDTGRVCIEPEDWWLAQAFKLCKTHMPVGSTVTWSVRPMFADHYIAPTTTDACRESATTLAQGLVNTGHILDLKLEEGDAGAVAALRVYEPPLR